MKKQQYKNERRTSLKDSYEYAKQSDYIGQDLLLEEARIPLVTKSIISLSFFGIVGFLVWSSLSTVNEVVKSNGEITPIKHIQSIQHIKGGVVDSINVIDGQLVEKEEVLYTLTGDNIKNERKRVLAKVYSLSLQRERLLSFIEKREPRFEEIAEKHNQKYEIEGSSQVQADARRTMQDSLDSERTIIEERLRTKMDEAITYESTVKNAKRNYQLAKEALILQKRLVRNDIAPKVTLTQVEMEKNRYENEYVNAKTLKAKIDNEIIELQERIKSLSASSAESAYERISQIDLLLEENEKVLQGIDQEIESLYIRAPIAGIVKGIEIQTVGGVIAAGQKIMEIVPIDGQVNAIIKIMPQDIGHVQVGMPVDLKVTSYQYNRYGSILGQIESISPSTFYSDGGVSYYRAIVKLSKNYVGNDYTKNLVLPGMTLQADILTSRKSILAYLMRPLTVSLDYALTER